MPGGVVPQARLLPLFQQRHDLCVALVLAQQVDEFAAYIVVVQFAARFVRRPRQKSARLQVDELGADRDEFGEGSGLEALAVVDRVEVLVGNDNE